MSDYWHKEYICPFWQAAGKKSIRCEGECVIVFPERRETAEYIARYCASFDYLLRGDVLVSSGHTVMALEDGKHGEEEREVVEKSKIIVDDKEVAVERILKDGTNYVKVRDLAAALDLEVSNKGNIAVLTHKEK